MKQANLYPKEYKSVKIIAAEQQSLFNAYKKGDFSAREKLIHYNWIMVIDRIKKRFPVSIFETSELLSIGTIGLIRAVDTFDSKKGYTFYSYASCCIDNEILMFLRKNKHLKNELSYDRIICVEKDLSFIDSIADDKDIEEDFLENSLYSDIQKIVSLLPEREKTILMQYFGIKCEKTRLKDIAFNLKIPQSHASKIKARALKKVELALKEYGYDNLGIARQRKKGGKNNV